MYIAGLLLALIPALASASLFLTVGGGSDQIKHSLKLSDKTHLTESAQQPLMVGLGYTLSPSPSLMIPLSIETNWGKAGQAISQYVNRESALTAAVVARPTVFWNWLGIHGVLGYGSVDLKSAYQAAMAAIQSDEQHVRSPLYGAGLTLRVDRSLYLFAEYLHLSGSGSPVYGYNETLGTPEEGPSNVTLQHLNFGLRYQFT